MKFVLLPPKKERLSTGKSSIHCFFSDEEPDSTSSNRTNPKHLLSSIKFCSFETSNFVLLIQCFFQTQAEGKPYHWQSEGNDGVVLLLLVRLEYSTIWNPLNYDMLFQQKLLITIVGTRWTYQERNVFVLSINQSINKASCKLEYSLFLVILPLVELVDRNTNKLVT